MYAKHSTVSLSWENGHSRLESLRNYLETWGVRRETHAQTYTQPRTSSLLKDLPQNGHRYKDDLLSFSMTSVLNNVGKVDLVCQGNVLLMLTNTYI